MTTCDLGRLNSFAYSYMFVCLWFCTEQEPHGPCPRRAHSRWETRIVAEQLFWKIVWSAVCYGAPDGWMGALD